MSVTRRGLLLAGGVGALATGCSTHSSSSGGVSPASPQPTSPTRRATGDSGSPAPVELPAVHAWTPSAGDLEPACKTAAVRHVEGAGNGPGRALQVLEAQYGGLLSEEASVLVVTRSWRVHGSRILADGHTYDVRLTRRGRTWHVDAVHPSRPGPPRRRLSRSARAVLGSHRIDLPPAATRDVASGQVHESVLRSLLTVSGTHRVTVSVIRSGHPLYVFGTDRLSDHPQGRAFDTWAIEGRPVVDPRTSRALVEDYMHAVAATGSYNVGGPYLLGTAPQWFSDDTHHDHVHAGFTG